MRDVEDLREFVKTLLGFVESQDNLMHRVLADIDRVLADPSLADTVLADVKGRLLARIDIARHFLEADDD